MNAPSSEAVLEFWFGEAADNPAALPERNRAWFMADDALDRQIRRRFGATLTAATSGKLKMWKLTPQGTLALIIVFDQFSRNIHRGTPLAFATDDRALALCRDAIAMGSDQKLSIVERLFFYLPLEHAEDREAQTKSVACFQKVHDDAPQALRQYTEIALQHAEQHRDLIVRFGRFPHRNLALNRTSNPAENEWLSAHRGAYGQG